MLKKVVEVKMIVAVGSVVDIDHTSRDLNWILRNHCDQCCLNFDFDCTSFVGQKSLWAKFHV